MIIRLVLLDPGPSSHDTRCDVGRPGPGFLVPALEQRTRMLPYFLSTTLHLVLMAMMALAATLFPLPRTVSQQNKAKTLIVRIPKQLFVPRLPDEQSSAVEVTKRLKERATQLITQLRTTRHQDAPPASTPPPEDRNPSSRSQAILIQPQYPMELRPLPSAPLVPSAMIWTPQVLPEAPRHTVLPGSLKRELPMPSMQQPIDQAWLSTLIPDNPSEAGIPTHPIALLSVSNAPVLSENVVVPPGNLIPTDANAEAAKGMHIALTSAARPSANTFIVSRQNERPNSSTPMTGESQAAVAASAQSDHRGVQVQGLEHPANGRFDIIIIQTSVEESLPSGVLTGKPVHTVYLQVGDTKDWIMHYCASNSFAIQRGGIVQLPDPRPLNAPYPRFTFRPNEPVAGPGPYILVHGIVDESGSMRNLQVIGPIRSGKSSLLDALSKWRFRPATRAESPEAIEMVLAIPAHKT